MTPGIDRFGAECVNLGVSGAGCGILGSSRKDEDAIEARQKPRVVSGTDLQSVPAKPPGLHSWGHSYVWPFLEVGKRSQHQRRSGGQSGVKQGDCLWLPLVASDCVPRRSIPI